MAMDKDSVEDVCVKVVENIREEININETVKDMEAYFGDTLSSAYTLEILFSAAEDEPPTNNILVASPRRSIKTSSALAPDYFLLQAIMRILIQQQN